MDLSKNLNNFSRQGGKNSTDAEHQSEMNNGDDMEMNNNDDMEMDSDDES